MRNGFGVTTIAHGVALSSGWTRRAIAFGAGAAGALAMAPIDILPAMIVPMTVAVWLIDGSEQTATTAKGQSRFWPSLRSAAGAGWWWGFGYFVAGLWWLGAACLIEPDQFAWALPIAVFGVPIILAVFPAMGFGLARALWMPRSGRVFSLTLGLGLSEWLRGFALTGFSWNEYGMALGNHLQLAQLASVIGLQGLTWVTMAIAGAPATLADDALDTPTGNASGRRFGATALAAVTLAALAVYGGVRLSAGSVGIVPGVKLRIMQPNLTENASFTYANRHQILQDYLTLSDRATSATTSGLADVTHLIWPESAFPFILAREPDALDAIANALPSGTTLLTGAARIDGQQVPGTPVRYFNSIEVVTHDGSIVDSYDKVHLVPFGEYLPFGDILERLGIHRFVNIPGGFTAGSRHRLLNAPGLPTIVPAICYEAIFSDDVMPDVPDAIIPGLILNLTNDSWFGQTAGPYQHFAQVRLRSIEQGLPLVRAGNTGISAIIDPYGRIIDQLPLGVANVLDGSLPNHIKRPLFVKVHRFLPGAFTAILLTIILCLRFRSRQPLYSGRVKRTSWP